MKNRVELTEKADGKTVYVVKPSVKNNEDAQLVYSVAFQKAVVGGAWLKLEVDNLMRQRKIWGVEDDQELARIDSEIFESLNKLRSGGIKLSEAKLTAFRVKELRMERLMLLSKRNRLDELTADSKAENEKFDFLVSVCTVDEEGNPIFQNIEDYKERSTEKYSIEAATTLARMLYNLEENWEKELPENQFLTKYKFVDDRLRLINKDGHLVDREGRLINEDGRFVDENNNFVDIYGKRVDENGLPIVDSQPFLDDDGKQL